MSIDRVPSVPFAQIANAALRDARLSFMARGVLAFVLSHPGDWSVSRSMLMANSPTEGQKAVQKALNELTALGYRVVVKRQREDGTWASVVQWTHDPSAQEATGCDCTDPSVHQRPVPVTANKNTIKNTTNGSRISKVPVSTSGSGWTTCPDCLMGIRDEDMADHQHRCLRRRPHATETGNE